MKPLLLKVAAFGPYAQRQRFDFRQLEGRNLFLVSGDTGAGKTTVFDALCVALYGESSGGARKASDLRSDFAEQGLVTDVELIFQLGQNYYRAWYQPDQLRPAKRGDGMVAMKGDASLHQLESLDQPIEQSQMLAEGLRKTRQRVEALLGLNPEQFRQVIMLAQGQFRQLLDAGSQERELIFEKLFQTQLYRRIEQALKDAAAGVTEVMKGARRELEMILEHAGVSDNAALVEALQLQEKLVVENEEAVDRARALAEKAAASLDSAQQGNSKLAELEQSRQALAALAARNELFGGKQRSLDAAVAAANVEPYHRQRAARLAELLQCQRQLKSLQQQAEKSAERLQEAKQQASGIPKLEHEHGELKVLREKLVELAPRIEKLQTTESELRAARVAVERQQGDRQQSEQAVAALEQRIAEQRAELQAVQKKQRDPQHIGEEIERLQRLQGQRQELDAVQATLRELDVQLEPARQAQVKMQAGYDDKLQSQKNLEAAWQASQAARLAQQLVSGESCPVCGSADHPQPAIAAQLVDDAEVETAAQALLEIKQSLDAAFEHVGGIAQEYNKCEAELKARQQVLGEQATLSLQSLKQGIADAIARRQQALSDVHKLAEGEQAIQKNDEQLGASKAARQVAAQAELEAEKQRAALQALQQQLKGDIDSRYNTPAKLSQALAEAEAGIEERARSIAGLRSELDECNALHSRLEGEVEAGRQALAAADAAKELAQGEFEQQLQQSSFATEAAYTDALLSRQKRDDLEAEIQRYQGECKSAQDRLHRIEAECKELQSVELEPLRQAKESTATQLEAAQNALGQQQERLHSLVRDRGRVDDAEKKITALQEEYRNVGLLAEVANGDNDLRLSFHRFILQSLLDEVLEVASRRLSKMTQGRFYLGRATELEDRRKQSGLDLRLTDTYSGTEREVRSLSGGESFMAALALALGLSDVVQSHAGGIRLDTIFIDEGFGSLSPEALDRAIEVLNGLGQDGRLVGIISHVPELKQQIDAQLLVESVAQGSTARFRV